MHTFPFSPSLLLAIYCILVTVASLAGGWLIFALRLNHTRMQMAISAVAGLMLGIAMLHFIPHAFHQNLSLDRTMQWVLGGFLLMFFLQRLFHYHHHHAVENAAEPNHSFDRGTRPAGSTSGSGSGQAEPADSVAHNLSWVGTTIGLSLHSLVDGVALASAAFVSTEHGNPGAGIGVALAVILHKPFGAMAISTLMVANGCSRDLRQLINILFALVTPLGAVLFSLGASHLVGANPAFEGNVLAFCAGTFLCIACADLLPELQFHSHDRFRLSIALLAGLVLAILLGYFGHADHPHHSHAAIQLWDNGLPGFITMGSCQPEPAAFPLVVDQILFQESSNL